MRCLDGQVALVMVGAQGLEDEYGQTPVHCRQARAVALDTDAPAPVLQVRITPTIHLTAPALLIPIATPLWAYYQRRGLVVVALDVYRRRAGPICPLILGFVVGIAVGIGTAWLRQWVIGRILPAQGGCLALLFDEQRDAIGFLDNLCKNRRQRRAPSRYPVAQALEGQPRLQGSRPGPTTPAASCPQGRPHRPHQCAYRYTPQYEPHVFVRAAY